MFEDERERATAVGIWAATAGLGVALGPVVGGVLLDHFWWGAIFIVNVPLCVLAIVVGRRVVPESRDPVGRRLDWTGAALSGAALIALVWAVIEAPSEGWTSPRSWRPAASPHCCSAPSCSSSGAPPSRCSTSGSSATRASAPRAPP